MTDRERFMVEMFKDIFVLARDCRSDMQGRLVDDEHRRAFAVLEAIYRKADSALNTVEP
jgi:hypothetical protein